MVRLVSANVGRQDHPAPHTASPPEDHILRSSRHIAEQRENIQPAPDCVSTAWRMRSISRAAPAGTRDITIAASERLAQCVQVAGVGSRGSASCGEWDDVNRVLLAQCSDHRRLQQVCERLCIQCCRHHQQALGLHAVRRQPGQVPATNHRQVCVHEIHRRSAGRRRPVPIILQTAQQQTLGQDPRSGWIPRSSAGSAPGSRPCRRPLRRAVAPCAVPPCVQRGNAGARASGMLRPVSHGSSSSNSGTSVVLLNRVRRSVPHGHATALTAVPRSPCVPAVQAGVAGGFCRGNDYLPFVNGPAAPVQRLKVKPQP